MSTQEDRARWIPVTERLPETNEHRISDWCVVYNYGEPGTAYYDSHIGCWYIDLSPTNSVTHWMPLPPPPAQQSQED